MKLEGLVHLTTIQCVRMLGGLLVGSAVEPSRFATEYSNRVNFGARYVDNCEEDKISHFEVNFGRSIRRSLFFALLGRPPPPTLLSATLPLLTISSPLMLGPEKPRR